MAKITLDDITSNYASVVQLNARFQLIEDQLNNAVFYRVNPEGEPNSLQNDLDMNNNDILNANSISAASFTLGGQQIQPTNVGVAQSEIKTLISGQKIVTFTHAITNASFYLTGPDVDNGRLVVGVDFTLNAATKTITLTESYPAGTQIVSVYYTGDESLIISGSETTVQSVDVENQTAAGGETSFTLLAIEYAVGTNSLWVYRDGVKLRVGQDYTETSPTTISLDPSLTVSADEEWQFISFVGVSAGGSSNAVIKRYTTSGDDSTTSFTLPWPVNAGGANTIVSIGGLVQEIGTYTAGGTSLVFSEAPPAGTDNIELILVEAVALGSTDATLVTYTATGGTERTLQSKLGETVSVKDFGAVGDGVTDDTAAIQAALTAALATPHGVLDLAGLNIKWIPTASYVVSSTLTIKNGTLTFAGTALVYVFRITDCDRFRLENLTIVGNSNGTIDDSFDATTGTYALVQVDPTADGSVKNLEIEGCDISGCIVVVDTKYQQGATGRFYTYNGYARHNKIYSVAGHAFALNMFKGFDISHNEFENIGALCVDFSTACKRCYFKHNRISVAAGIGKFQSHISFNADNYVSDCEISHNYAVGLTLGNSNNVAAIKNTGIKNIVAHNYFEYDGTGAAVEGIVNSGTCRILYNNARQLNSVTRSFCTTITDAAIEALDLAPKTTIHGNTFEGFNYGIRLQNTADTNIEISGNKQSSGARFVFIEPSVTLLDIVIRDNEADLSATSGSMGIQSSSSVTDIDGIRILNNYFRTDSNCILIYKADGALVHGNRLHSVSGSAFVPITMTSYSVVGNYSNVAWATTATTNIQYQGNIV